MAWPSGLKARRATPFVAAFTDRATAEAVLFEIPVGLVVWLSPPRTTSPSDPARTRFGRPTADATEARRPPSPAASNERRLRAAARSVAMAMLLECCG